ncbi:MAG: M6 family metalloprotease domain-containing protein, partial [Bacteroidales bacterium]|nr:M6 family metalloprotease domain-containing protein [Bacteroidales bacterium]
MKKIVFLVILFFALGVTSFAAYLEKHPIIIKQPDGTEVQCFATGDEYYNWVHDAEGYTLIRDPQTGYVVYAKLQNDELVSTKYIVGTVDPVTLGLSPWTIISAEKREQKRRNFLNQTPQRSSLQSAEKNRGGHNAGTINNLTVFIRFSDDTEFEQSVSYYNAMFNDEQGVSMYNYFKEVSYGTTLIPSTFYPTPNGEIVLSYQDSNPRSYYQPYNSSSNPNGYQVDDDGRDRRMREHTLLKNAIESVAHEIPSDLNLDFNGDTYVDNVCFIIKGATGGWSELLWPHQWSLYSLDVRINNKRVYSYNFQLDDDLSWDAASVLAHEMFHTLGAPDYYHYSYDGLHPVGSWDLMASNMYPPQSSLAYTKWKYGGWIDHIPAITTNGVYELNNVWSEEKYAYKIFSSNSSTEYFMVEYRDKNVSWDANIPGTGVLIYRVNTIVSGNADGAPDEVYIYRPGGTNMVNGSINSAHYGVGGRMEISNTTSPSCFLTNGSSGGIHIKNITIQSDGAATFEVDGLNDEGCNIAIEMWDSRSDGWDGNAQIEVLQNNEVISTAKLHEGGYAVYHVAISSGSIDFRWVEGTFDLECSFMITMNSDMIYQSSGMPSVGIFHSDVCRSSCPTVSNLTAEVQGTDVKLLWDAPEETPTGYKLYQNSIEIATITETSYLIRNLTSGDYSFSVEALYGDDCFPEKVYVSANIEVGNSVFNLSVTKLENDKILVEWEEPNELEERLSYLENLDKNRGISASNYDIYINDEKVGSTTETFYEYTVPNAGNYNVCVVAKYPNGAQSAKECEQIEIGLSLDSPIATTATNISHTGFTANWEAVNGAESYILDVYEGVPNSSELVVNGSFETGNRENWAGDNIAYFNITTANPHSGNYYLSRSTTSGTSRLEQTVSLETGKTYILSFWYNNYAATSTHGLKNYSIQGTTGSNYIEGRDPVKLSAASEWTRYEQEFTATTSSVKISIRAYEPCDIDDISVTEKVEPILNSPFIVTGISKEISNLTPGEYYFYNVKAKAGDLESEPSNTISVALPNLPTLTITSPQNGVIIYGQDVDIEFEVEDFAIGTDGKIKYIVDSGEPQYHTTDSKIELIDLSYDAHAVLLELVDMQETPLSIPVTAEINFICSDVVLCGSEPFTNSVATGNYGYGTFVGNNDVTWTFDQARNEGEYPINGKGLMLRRGLDSYLESATISGGIGDFEVKMRKAFTGNVERKLELYINGELKATSQGFGNSSAAEATIHTFSVSDINISGNFTIKIKPFGTTSDAQQMTIDDIVWTCYIDADPPIWSEGYPQIANVGNDLCELIVNMNELGKAYYLPLTKDSPVPTIDDIIENGNIILIQEANVNHTEYVSNLAAGTDYVIYVVAQDNETPPNTQTNFVTLELTTISQSNLAEMLTFSLPGQIGETTITDGNILIDMPDNIDLTNLIAAFTISENATIAIDDIEQESGVTINDFSEEIIYTITAENGVTTKNWVVSINLLSTNATVTSSVYAVDNEFGTISGVPYYTSLELFKSNIAAASLASYAVYEMDETTVATSLADGYKVIVTAQAGNIKTYVINMPAPNGDLFFSEYLEGSSNNKALEIYNGTGVALDLSRYSIKLGSNGAAFSTTLSLGGILENEAAYVIAHSSAKQSILNVANRTYGGNVLAFNGDDALGLFNGGVLIDVIGKEGERPSGGWNVAGIEKAALDHTLIRKSSIMTGNTAWESSAGTNEENSEWQIYPCDYIGGLGFHKQPLLSAEADILTFNAGEGEINVHIDNEANTVTVGVRHETNITTLTPIITVSEGASIDPNSGEEQDFSSIVNYTVTAEGENNQIWKVSVVKYSNDATLSDIKINGESIEAFSPEIMSYNIALPYGTTGLPITSYTLNDENATAVQTNASQIPGTTTIVVTSQDGTVENTYSLNFIEVTPFLIVISHENETTVYTPFINVVFEVEHFTLGIDGRAAWKLN